VENSRKGLDNTISRTYTMSTKTRRRMWK